MSTTDYNRAGNAVAPVNEERQVKKEGQASGLPITALQEGTSQKATEGESMRSPTPMSRPAGLVVACAVAVCITAAIVHVCMVFLSVAPPNIVSQRYEGQINTWVYPYFEQNWRLFAPDPEGARRQILARTATTSRDGDRQVSGWVDLSAIDADAVRHNPFPSHISQNMLRRAWSSYLDSHGTSDRSNSERAEILRKYLLNIATQRLAAHSHRAFDAVQLHVITTPIASPALRGADKRAVRSPSDSRYLPWWQVTSHDN
ncbi:DUF5819 family protein [Streptomyces lydicus]|uniref:DUF5819 family protein n=1 Tax=Streptomyces lydicus TaxID=47763 RepID=UPI001F470768|nr:DUF5819 family protein [Streptomyces lydicus]